MTVAAAHMFGEIADEFRIYLDQEGYKSNKQIKAKITGIRKLRPHIEQIVKRNMQANLTDVIKEGAEGTRTALATSFGLTNDEAVSFASKHTSTLAGEIADNSVETVRKTITDGIKNGRPVKVVRQELEEKFADWGTARAETVARSETLRAANMGSLEVLKKGGVAYKQWIAASDACETCLALNGETYPVSENFMAKGDTISTPTINFEDKYMAMPAPPVHPRCRCTIGGIPGSMVTEYNDEMPAGLSEDEQWKWTRNQRVEIVNQIAGGDLAKEWEPAIGEALQNVVRHADGKDVSVTVRRVGDRVSIFFRDKGTGFIPKPEQWVMPSFESGATHGRGLPTISLMSDSAMVQKMNEGGTLLRMTKDIPQLGFPMPGSTAFDSKTASKTIESMITEVNKWDGTRGKYATHAIQQASESKYEQYAARGIAMTDGEETVGMASVYKSPRGHTQLGFLATKRPGYGEHMMKQIAKEVVASDGGGLELIADMNAAGFYEHIGMHKTPGGIYKWSAEEVAKYATR